jgi:hypothetical protein
MYERTPDSVHKMQVLTHFNTAVEHARCMFFQPFKFEKWLLFGVIIFLEMLFNSGGCGSSGNFSNGSSGGGAPDLGTGLQEFEAWVAGNLALIVLFGIVLLAVMLIVAAVITYVSSRGSMMLIRAVAENDERIGENWKAAGPATMSLFWFRMVVGILNMAFWVAVVLLVYLSIRSILLSETEFAGGIAALLGLLALFAGVVQLGFAIVFTLQRQFVSPIMLYRGQRCLDAWRTFRQATQGNVLAIIGFVLLRFAYSMAFSIVAMFVGCPDVAAWDFYLCCIMPCLRPIMCSTGRFRCTWLGSAGPEFQFINFTALWPEAYPPEPPPMPGDGEPMDDTDRGF